MGLSITEFANCRFTASKFRERSNNGRRRIIWSWTQRLRGDNAGSGSPGFRSLRLTIIWGGLDAAWGSMSKGWFTFIDCTISCWSRCWPSIFTICFISIWCLWCRWSLKPSRFFNFFQKFLSLFVLFPISYSSRVYLRRDISFAILGWGCWPGISQISFLETTVARNSWQEVHVCWTSCHEFET